MAAHLVAAVIEQQGSRFANVTPSLLQKALGRLRGVRLLEATQLSVHLCSGSPPGVGQTAEGPNEVHKGLMHG